MFGPITTDEGLHEIAVNIFHVARTEVTRVSKDSVRYLAKIVFYLLNHRNELSLVIGILGNIRTDNDLGVTINGSLSIVGLFKGFGGPIEHDPAFWVREITLLLRFGYSWKRFGTTTALPRWIHVTIELGRLSRFPSGLLFQRRLRLFYLLYPTLFESESLWNLIPTNSFAVFLVFKIICGLRPL